MNFKKLLEKAEIIDKEDPYKLLNSAGSIIISIPKKPTKDEIKTFLLIISFKNNGANKLTKKTFVKLIVLACARGIKVRAE